MMSLVESFKSRLEDGEGDGDDETDDLGLSWPAARRGTIG